MKIPFLPSVRALLILREMPDPMLSVGTHALFQVLLLVSIIPDCSMFLPGTFLEAHMILALLAIWVTDFPRQ